VDEIFAEFKSNGLKKEMNECKIEKHGNATPEKLFPYVGKVRSFAKKTKWLTAIAKQIKQDKNIPLTMERLIELPGIGRKSANVIMREAKVKAAKGLWLICMLFGLHNAWELLPVLILKKSNNK